MLPALFVWAMAKQLPIVERLERERETLMRELNIELPKIIEEARAHGDLRENAEYHAAKERQGMVHARLGSIDESLRQLSMYSYSSIPRGVVGYGSVVELEDSDSGARVRYQMVFSEEVDPAGGRISITSPVGQALLNKSEGDEVQIRLPGGVKSYEIIEIQTIHDREEA